MMGFTMAKKDIGCSLLSVLLIYWTFGSDKDLLPGIMSVKDILHLFIDVSPLSSLLVFVCFVGVVWLLYLLANKKVGRLSHSVMYASFSIFIFVEMVRHPMNITWFSLLSSSFFIAFVFETSRLLDVKYDCAKAQKSIYGGFIADNQKIENNEDVGWDKYAINLVKRLILTDTSEGSFAVGLTGKWGTGKTTFLEIMKNNLIRQNVYVLDFNPWLSDSTKMIVNDYFNSLKDVLVGKEPKIDKVIDKYVNLLLKWQAPSLLDKVNAYIDKEGLGLQSVRNQISDLLNELDKPIVVFIDDLDRLQQNEILEVLKLIRNTADFSNMMYVVPFDKTYVLGTIKTAISEPALYLKKIFQLELRFPLFESYLFTHFLLSELDKYHHLHDVKLRADLKNIENELLFDDINLSDYFDNFRDIKRFVNSVLLVFDYIEKQGVVKDFRLRDIFLIELLSYTDEPEYELLKNSPQDRLEPHENKAFYQLKADMDKKVADKSYRILHALFASSLSLDKDTDYVSMRRKNKFFTYFSFRPFSYQMSITNFLNILKMQDEKEVREEIKNTRNGIFSKSGHLYDLMMITRMRVMNPSTLTNYMAVLEEWTKLNLDFERYKIVRLFHKILSSKLDDEVENVSIVRKSFRDISNWLMCDVNQGCYILQSILTSMLTGKFEHQSDGYKTVINYGSSYYANDIEEYNRKNIAYFLKSIRPSIYSIYDNSRLHAFLESSAILSMETIPQRALFSSVEDSLIHYFSKSKHANDPKKFFDKFYYVDLSFGLKEGGDEEFEKLVKKYFISIPFYIRFLRECFEYKTPTELDEYIEKNHLQVWTS